MGEVLTRGGACIEVDTVPVPRPNVAISLVGRLNRHLSDVPVAGMNRAALQGYLAKRIEEGAALRTIRGEFISLRHAWRIGIERG
jgi:hypothetical protein